MVCWRLEVGGGKILVLSEGGIGGNIYKEEAHVAELADACASGAHGETLGGSSPLVSRGLTGFLNEWVGSARLTILVIKWQ